MRRCWVLLTTLFLTGLAYASPLESGSAWSFAGNALLDLFWRAGSLALPVLGLTILGLALAVERLLVLRPGRQAPPELQKDVRHVLETRGLDSALAYCLQRDCALSQTLYAALLHYRGEHRAMHAAVAEESRRIRYQLQRNIRPIAALALLTPAVGLLGGAIRLIGALDLIARGAHWEQVAAGLGDFIILFMSGFMGGVVLALVCFYLYAKAGDLVHHIERHGLEVIVGLERKARQSPVLADIEEQLETQDVSSVRVTDLALELEDPAAESGAKNNMTTAKHRKAEPGGLV